MEGIDALAEKKGVLRAGGGPQIPHQVSAAFGDVGGGAELLGVDHAVVGIVRCGQSGIFVRMSRPVKAAAVHNDAAQGSGVAVQVFGGGMDDDIRPEFKGTAIDGGREGIVHNQWHAVGVSQPGVLLDIQDVECGIGQGFPKDQLGVGAEGGLNGLVRRPRLQEGDLDAHLPQGFVEQVEGAAVNSAAAEDMIAAVGDVQHG